MYFYIESVIEVGLVFDFWILGADFYSSFYLLSLNKCHFHEFQVTILFESLYYYRHYGTLNF